MRARHGTAFNTEPRRSARSSILRRNDYEIIRTRLTPLVGMLLFGVIILSFKMAGADRQRTILTEGVFKIKNITYVDGEIAIKFKDALNDRTIEKIPISIGEKLK